MTSRLQVDDSVALAQQTGVRAVGEVDDRRWCFAAFAPVDKQVDRFLIFYSERMRIYYAPFPVIFHGGGKKRVAEHLCKGDRYRIVGDADSHRLPAFEYFR